MRIKKQLNTNRVDQISGTPSIELLEHCPDMRNVFPSKPCTNRGCDYAIKQRGYMNCTFVAAQAGEHTLDQIGEMIGITREGVRLIEKRGLRKLEIALGLVRQDDATLCEPDASAGTNHVIATGDDAECSNKGNRVRALDDRKLAQWRR